jgi:hypothetical protein
MSEGGPAPTLPNEFEWSINEGAKLPPPIVDLPQSPSEALSFAPEQPIPNFSSTTSLPVYPQASDLSGSSFTFEEFPKFEETMIIESQPVTPHSHDYSAPPSVQVAPISTTQVENLMQKELQTTIEKMAKEMLPEIAEKIIRAEIQKLLSESP